MDIRALYHNRLGYLTVKICSNVANLGGSEKILRTLDDIAISLHDVAVRIVFTVVVLRARSLMLLVLTLSVMLVVFHPSVAAIVIDVW